MSDTTRRKLRLNEQENIVIDIDGVWRTTIGEHWLEWRNLFREVRKIETGERLSSYQIRQAYHRCGHTRPYRKGDEWK